MATQLTDSNFKETVIDSGKVSHNIATQKIFPKMLEDNSKSPAEIAKENNLLVLEDFAQSVGAEYKQKQAGKKMKNC